MNMVIDENWLYPKDFCSLKLGMDQIEKPKAYSEKGG